MRLGQVIGSGRTSFLSRTETSIRPHHWVSVRVMAKRQWLRCQPCAEAMDRKQEAALSDLENAQDHPGRGADQDGNRRVRLDAARPSSPSPDETGFHSTPPGGGLTNPGIGTNAP